MLSFRYFLIWMNLLVLIIISVADFNLMVQAGMTGNENNILREDEDKRGASSASETDSLSRTAKRGLLSFSDKRQFLGSSGSGSFGDYQYSRPSSIDGSSSYYGSDSRYSHHHGYNNGPSSGYDPINRHPPSSYPGDYDDRYYHPSANQDNNFGSKMLGFKKILLPLAGLAILGVAAAAASQNPVLLQLGSITGRRRKRSVELDQVYPANHKVKPINKVEKKIKPL